MNDLIPRERIAGWQKLKTLVLLRNSIPAPLTQRFMQQAFLRLVRVCSRVFRPAA